jgi:hypothetical protein
MKNIEDILKLTDEIAIIESVGKNIWDKKEESEDFRTLTDGEKTFVYIDMFEGAMHEGGFAYFFDFECGDYAKEVIAAYKNVGAPKTANIVAKAVGLFGINNYFDTLEKREVAIAKLDENVVSGWEDLDEIFFNDEQEEDVVSLIVEFIRNKKEQF